jgi:hypothetical protein
MSLVGGGEEGLIRSTSTHPSTPQFENDVSAGEYV